MTDSPYPDPPEGLAEQVATAVERRLKDETARNAFGFFGDELTIASLEPMPFYALATRQPVSIRRLHGLIRPSSWGFSLTFQERDGEAPALLASAGASSGGSFRFSNILSVPPEIFSVRVLNEYRSQMDADSIAVLEVPSYYLAAIWARTSRPEDDRLLFFIDSFGLFPPLLLPFRPVELSELVEYLNDRLAKGDAAKTKYQMESAD